MDLHGQHKLARVNRIQVFILAVWASASILAGSMLTSFHQPFRLSASNILSLTTTSRQYGWRALHLLGADCDCSRKVSEHLAERGPLKDITEEVVFIGDPDKFTARDRLVARGFRVSTISAEDLRRFGLKGVPVLVFVSPQDQIAYIGGYGAGSYKDAAIWDRLQAGSVVSPLPVLGCAVGGRLRRELDPLSWKYARENQEED